MSWRAKLAVPEPDGNDRPVEASVTCVSSSVDDEIAPTLSPEPERADYVRARFVLNQAGVRKFFVDAELTIGVWSDLDNREIRAALRALGAGNLPVRYLDGPGIPAPYKLRAVDGDSVPQNVLEAMQQDALAPWDVRDQMLSEMNCGQQGLQWAEWKAATLNQLFLQLGRTGETGRITAETVRHGERERPDQK
jgi:hypothetical protein